MPRLNKELQCSLNYMMSGYAESELWQAFKKGDEQAFARIYTSYVKVLYRYGLKITTDKLLIEDCIQELFIDLWKSRTRLSETDSIKFYLFRIMRRKLFQQLSSQTTFQGDEMDLSHRLTTESYESELIVNQETAFRKDKLHQAITLLPARQREAVNLRYFHEFSYEQIAELMEINLQSVHNTLHKAMKLLRAHLSITSSVSLLGFFRLFL